MDLVPRPLAFSAASLQGLSERLIASHHQNNYTGAVKRLNAIRKQLDATDWPQAPGFVVNGLKREELIATNSMILHEVYFDSMGGGGQLQGPLADAIKRDFGSVERWRTEFTAMGKAEGGGSGWVILSYSPRAPSGAAAAADGSARPARPSDAPRSPGARRARPDR